jgi:hypothetical protein
MRIVCSSWELGRLSFKLGAAVILLSVASCGASDNAAVDSDAGDLADPTATVPAVPPGEAASEPPSVAIAPDGATPTPAFENSMVPAAKTTSLPPTLPVPQLIPPTSPRAHVPTIATGRSDPFAPFSPSNIVVTAQPAPAPPSPAVVPPSAPPAPSFSDLPAVSVAALPPLRSPGDPDSLSTLPAAPSQPLAERIEISGFLEVGGAANLIVMVPGEHTSRPARVGERLANGAVLIKHVSPQPGGDVVVILEQDGVEYRRSVGGGASTLMGAL